MTQAHKRQKDPDGVRRSLLDHASAIAAQQGLNNVTVAAVASAAGVTKGALFHHFDNKQALIEAMFDDLMEQLDERIGTLIAADPVQYGRFTRAYLYAATSASEDDNRVWRAIFSTLSPGSELCLRWYMWLDKRLDMYHTTDTEPELEIVRLAADGAWLMAMTRTSMFDMSQLRERLLAMTTDVARPRP